MKEKFGPGTTVIHGGQGPYDGILQIVKIPKSRRSLRANVEATVSEFSRKINNRKLKVRGLFKTELFAYAGGISVTLEEYIVT